MAGVIFILFELSFTGRRHMTYSSLFIVSHVIIREKGVFGLSHSAVLSCNKSVQHCETFISLHSCLLKRLL